MLYIYQMNNSFYPYAYKITITQQLTEEQKWEYDFYISESNEVLVRDDTEKDHVLSFLTGTVETLSLTDKQLDRLNECQNINAQFDDVVFYVENGDFPSREHSLKILEIKKQQERIAALEDAILQLTGI